MGENCCQRLWDPGHHLFASCALKVIFKYFHSFTPGHMRPFIHFQSWQHYWSLTILNSLTAPSSQSQEKRSDVKDPYSYMSLTSSNAIRNESYRLDCSYCWGKHMSLFNGFSLFVVSMK